MFVGENRPLIDVTPVAIEQVQLSSGEKQAQTVFSIANYSGFTAYDIAFDTRYGDDTATWIGEWAKADTDRQAKGPAQNVELTKFYNSRPVSPPGMEKLDAGETIQNTAMHHLISQGSLDLERTVCERGTKGFQYRCELRGAMKRDTFSMKFTSIR